MRAQDDSALPSPSGRALPRAPSRSAPCSPAKRRPPLRAGLGASHATAVAGTVAELASWRASTSASLAAAAADGAALREEVAAVLGGVGVLLARARRARAERKRGEGLRQGWASAV
jgi:hypothetical protein